MMDIRTPEGFSKLTYRESVVASVVLSILKELEELSEYVTLECRAVAMDRIEADVINLVKLFYYLPAVGGSTTL